MRTYEIQFSPVPNSIARELWRCEAENMGHAIEQLKDEHPNYKLLEIKIIPAPSEGNSQ